jgi:zinc transport system substrate-binding protein
MLQGADLVVLNGAGLESWRSRVSLRESRVVETGESIRSRWIETDGPTHSHGMSGSHSHAGTASRTWLDPTLAIEQARMILKSLSQARPELAADFERNFKALEKDLLDLDARYESAVGGRGERPVLFSHPVYDYLIRRYGLNARSLDWEPGEMPYEEQWDALASTRGEFPADAILWEATPIEPISRRLAGMGIESFTFEPCGNVRPSEWLDAMRRNADALRAALE